MILRFVAHSHRVVSIARKYGWLPGARYTNLRDLRKFETIGFIDIDWKNYSFTRHLQAVKAVKPLMTVARDVTDPKDLRRTLDQAFELLQHSRFVVIVPKHQSFAGKLDRIIPQQFILGYSVPTRYGGTMIPPQAFNRPVHILGGRPEVQRRMAELMPVLSVDCNRFTLDASFGDFFDGEIFRRHPVGGYQRCIRDSIRNINGLWKGYHGGCHAAHG